MFRKKKDSSFAFFFEVEQGASSVIPKKPNTGYGFGLPGGGWRQPLPFFACSVAGQLSSPLSTLLHFPILRCPCAHCHRGEHVFMQKRCFCSCAFVPLVLNVNISACSFVWKKKPTISWVGSLKRCRPLKHFLGVWAKTNNNFVITCLTDSADTQIANRFGCFYSQMLCPFLLHFPFSVRSWEIFYSFKNKTRSFFADHTDFFNISHTRIYI